MAKGFEQGGTAGTAGMASELAVGFGIAQQMLAQSGMTAPPTPPVAPGAGAVGGVAAAAAAPSIDLLGVADVAKTLGVSDADVMSVIESGELKAKKIGSTYRVTRAALDSYLAN